MEDKPKIAIIGSGPGGLCLARILHQNNIPFTIFESDASPTTRRQGGSLDLHPPTGQQALKDANLFDEWQKRARYSGESLVLMDRFGKQHVNVQGVNHGRPEIGRPILRQILLDSVPASTIRWNAHVRSVDVGTIRFDDGHVEDGFDLIVGADGAWSKVRPLLTSVPPFYSGVTGIEMWFSDVDARHPEISAMVGEGSAFMFGEDEQNALLMQRQDDRGISMYALFTAPEHFTHDSGVDWTEPAQVREMLLERFGGWAEEQRDLIRKTDDDMTARPMYMLPVGVKWPSRKGLTAIGDAAHLMTPFAGEGANLALTDAMVLAREIVKSPDDLNRAVREYEKEMFPRAADSMQRTWHSLQSRFAPGGIAEFTSRITRVLDRMGLDRQKYILSDITSVVEA